MRGKRIVVTRAQHQAEEPGTLLRQRGAIPLFYPCIAIAPPRDLALLDAALLAAAEGDFDWLVLTSANTVPVLAQRLKERDIAPQRLDHLKLACVGPATAEAVTSQLGLRVQILPETYVAEALLETLKTRLPARILLLQADIARPLLSQELTRMGALVCALAAYRTIQGNGGVHLAKLLRERQVDAITFTSASTVYQCVRRVEAEGGAAAQLAGVCLASIGPLTSRALRELGFAVAVEPAEHTLEGLITELERYFQQQAGTGAF